MKKQVLIVSHEWPDYIGGVGLVGFQLARTLASESDVVVLTRKIENLRQIDNVRLRLIPDGRFFWIIYYALYLLFNQKKYDAIVLNETAPTICAGLSLSRKVLEKKVVCILHGLEVEHFYRSISLKRPFRLFHERAVIAAKKRIFVSRFYLEKYSQNVRSISRQGNEVIYPELSISKVPMENVDSHRVETLRFITVSRFDLKKGFRHIAPIIACLRDSKVKFSWTLVGDGPDQQLIKNMFEEYEEVEIFGSASREVIPRLYEKADIFCQISDYEETFGLVYTEAQLHGLFCIASFLGATSESIIEGNGCLVNSADLNATKILSAIFDRPAKSVIRQKCLAKFQHQNKKWAGAIYDDFSV